MALDVGAYESVTVGIDARRDVGPTELFQVVKAVLVGDGEF